MNYIIEKLFNRNLKGEKNVYGEEISLKDSVEYMNIFNGGLEMDCIYAHAYDSLIIDYPHYRQFTYIFGSEDGNLISLCSLITPTIAYKSTMEDDNVHLKYILNKFFKRRQGISIDITNFNEKEENDKYAVGDIDVRYNCFLISKFLDNNTNCIDLDCPDGWDSDKSIQGFRIENIPVSVTNYVYDRTDDVNKDLKPIHKLDEQVQRNIIQFLNENISDMDIDKRKKYFDALQHTSDELLKEFDKFFFELLFERFEGSLSKEYPILKVSRENLSDLSMKMTHQDIFTDSGEHYQINSLKNTIIHFCHQFKKEDFNSKEVNKFMKEIVWPMYKFELKRRNRYMPSSLNEESKNRYLGTYNTTLKRVVREWLLTEPENIELSYDECETIIKSCFIMKIKENKLESQLYDFILKKYEYVYQDNIDDLLIKYDEEILNLLDNKKSDAKERSNKNNVNKFSKLEKEFKNIQDNK